MNDKGGNDKRPDRRGTINIEGVEYKLSGWLRTPKNGGDKFLSLKAERSDKQQEPGRERTPASDRAAAAKNDSGWIDDDANPPF